MRSPTALVVALAALLLTASLGAAALQPAAPPVGAEGEHRPSAQELETSPPWPADPQRSPDVRSTAIAPDDDGTARYPTVEDNRSAIANRTQPDPATPRQVIRIELAADGDATWTIESRYRLETREEYEAFEAFAAEVTAGERDVGYDAARYEPFVAVAANATGREMEIVDAGWVEPAVTDGNETIPLEDAEFENDSVATGVVAYRFTWTDFARTDGSRIYLGDVFRTDAGTWFQSLADGQRLVVEAPSNYGYEELPRTPEDGALVWNGPYEFGEDELSVTYLQGADPSGNETDTTGPTTGDPGGSGGSGESTGGDPGEGTGFPSATAAFGLLVLLLLIGVAGYYLAQREPASLPTLSTSRGANGGTTDAAAEESRAEPTASGSVSAGESDAGSRSDGVVSTYEEGGLEEAGDAAEPEPDSDEDGTDEDGADEEVDVTLLSDEERVHRLLRRNDGRMKQVSIVSETGWSNAKVSQLLSEMDENGEIEKLRIGRENLITLPEVDPTEID